MLWLAFLDLCNVMGSVNSLTFESVPLSLSPSRVTRKKTTRKKWSREILRARRARKEFARPGVFFHVTHHGLLERGTTRSLQTDKHARFVLQRNGGKRKTMGYFASTQGLDNFYYLCAQTAFFMISSSATLRDTLTANYRSETNIRNLNS